jgi:hypothetical protein
LWWVGSNPFFAGHLADHPQIGHWFGRDYVEELAAFCQHSTEEFYQQVAACQQQPEAMYYVEKHHAAGQIPVLTWELFPHAREIVLVRDFRDMVASMLAFNAKRGYASFGRERVNSDEDFVKQLKIGVEQLLRSWNLRSETAHLVRYEDLILEPERTLRGMFDYLHVDASDDTVAGVMRRALEEGTDLEQHRTSKDPKTSIGRWRQDLSPTLCKLCHEAFGKALQAFDYPDHDTTDEPAVLSQKEGRNV